MRIQQFCFLFVGLLAGLTSASAWATMGWTESRYFAAYDYSLEAYGKPVARVEVHTGVEQRDALTGKTFWVDVQHFALERGEGRFYGRTELSSRSTTHGPFTLGPVVQYWVTFEDGSRLVSAPTPIALNPEQRERYWLTVPADERVFRARVEEFRAGWGAGPEVRTRAAELSLSGVN